MALSYQSFFLPPLAGDRMAGVHKPNVCGGRETQGFVQARLVLYQLSLLLSTHYKWLVY